MGLFSALKSFFGLGPKAPPVTEEELGAIQRVSVEAAQKVEKAIKANKKAAKKTAKKPAKKPAKKAPKKEKKVKVEVTKEVVDEGKKLDVDVVKEIKEAVKTSTEAEADVQIVQEVTYDPSIDNFTVKPKKPRKLKKAVDSTLDPAKVKIED